MPSNPKAFGEAAASAAVKARMAKFLLHGEPAATPRAITLLQKNNVLKKIDPFGANRRIIELLLDANHPRRFRCSPGPLLFELDPNTNLRHVYDVVSLLYSHDADVRAAALKYFQTDALLATMNRRTVEQLGIQAAEITSSARTAWQVASVRIEDEIRDDLRMSLSALRQTLETSFDDGYRRYLPRVLRPTYEALQRLDLPLWNADDERDQIATSLREIAQNSDNLATVLSDYLSRYGHVPLGGTFAASELVACWAEDHGVQPSWEALWSWADEQPTPLARYHVCQILAQHPEWVPAGKHLEFWREVGHIVQSPADERPYNDAWRLRCELARHYCHYVECLAPGSDANRVSTMAWWLAEQFAGVYANDNTVLQRVRETISTNEYALSREMWQLVTPPVVASQLRYSTLFLHSVWSLALQTQLAPGLKALHPNLMDEETRRTIEDALVASALFFFPLKPSSQSMYAFDPTVLPTIDAFVSVDGAAVRLEMLRAFAEVNRKLTNHQEVGELLEQLGISTQADEVVIAQLLRVMAYHGAAPEQLIWQHLADEAWRDRVLLKCRDDTLALLADTLIQLQVQFGRKWVAQLPHLFATSAEKSSDEDRRTFLFGLTVLAATAGGTSSAIDRLVKGEHRHRFAEDVKNWRDRIAAVHPHSSGWVAAHLRSTLASLHL